jgi:hypothetical protein
MNAATSLVQPGKGKGLDHGWHKAVLGNFSEKWLSLRVPLANRPVVRGRETVVDEEP